MNTIFSVLDWLAGDGIWPGFIFAVLVFAYKLLRPYILEALAKSRLDAIYTAVEKGVAATYEEYTKDIKAASADDKLTEQEAAEARRRATAFAVSTLKSVGVDVLKTYGQEWLDRLIAAFVGESKAATMAKQVLVPLPELEPLRS